MRRLLSLITLCGIALLVIMPLPSDAAIFLSDELISPADDIDDDVYAVGQRLEFRHRIGSDLVTAGNDIAILEAVDQDIVAAGNQVRIQATVGDDIMAVGNTIDINETTTNDVFIAGSSISVGDDTNVSGDVYAAGQTIVISGTITGSVRAAGDHVVLRPNARIAGDLIVYGQRPATIESGATVGGDVTHHQQATRTTNNRTFVLDWVRSVLTWFVGALVLLYLFPKAVRLILHRATSQPLESFGIGMLWLLVTIPLVGILMLTVLGWPLALLWGMITLSSGLLAMLLTSLLLGHWLYVRVLNGREQAMNWQHALLGAFTVQVAALVPLLGPLLLFVIGAVLVGATGMVLWRIGRGDTGEISTLDTTTD